MPRDSSGSFLFAYFTGEGLDGEQVRFAVSDVDHPLDFTELRNGKPMLRSTLGELGVRDPFVVRNEVQGGFHVIGTDLCIHRDDDWGRATTWGSQAVDIWDSPDLVTWSEPRRATIAPENAGCAWAPEAFFVPERDAHMVVWSSSLFASDDPNRRRPTHLRVMRSFTRDFRSFTTPEVYIDPGHSVIDTTFLQRDGVTYRFTKDERPRSLDPQSGKHIFQEAATDGLLSTDFRRVAEGIGSAHLDRGEGPIAVDSSDGLTSYLLIDEFGGRGYQAFASTDPATGIWDPVPSRMPPGARHGGILPITAAERTALLRLV